MADPLVDPADLPLASVLNAGYVMLVQDADPEARALLDTLFAADSEEEMEAAFTDLRTLASWRESKAKEIEQRAGHTDKPVFGRRVGTELEQAAAEWTEIALRSQGVEPPGPDGPEE